MITTKFYFNDKETDDLNGTMTITMPIHEWKQLRKSLKNKYPDWQLSAQIGKMIQQVEQVLIESEEINN